MKKLITILSVIVIAASVSCSEKPDVQPYSGEPINPNAPTSFVFIHNIDNHTLPNCVAGYYGEDGLCHKIADLGDMVKGVPTPEITLEDDAIAEIRLFTDYFSPRVFRRSFPIVKHTKNVFELREDDYANEADKDDPTQWPH
jgi:hypothetical protein